MFFKHIGGEGNGKRRSIGLCSQHALAEDEPSAEEMLSSNYPFALPKKQKRSFSEKQKLAIYFRDGFVDRYNGKKLVNPGLLKCFSIYFPKTFPYHPHWKMTECHVAYWELLPTVDHENILGSTPNTASASCWA